MSKLAMMAAVATAAGLSAPAPESDLKIDQGFISLHFPDIAAGFKAEGARLERERIVAIDLAALPGHEKLVAEYKADSSKTAGDLALAIIATEKQARANMLSSLDTDEQRMKGLAPQPANGLASDTPADKPALAGEALWKSEFASSKDLQTEFGSEGAYLAFKRAEDRGGIRVMTPRKA
jgi:capsid assembly protease